MKFQILRRIIKCQNIWLPRWGSLETTIIADNSTYIYIIYTVREDRYHFNYDVGLYGIDFMFFGT